MDAYKEVFLEESAEFLQSVTDGLLQLERDPDDLGPVEEVFRGVHSLKGMSAAMGYDRTSDLSHRMESLAQRIRGRELPVTHEIVDLMLDAVDTVRALIDDEGKGTEAVDSTSVIAALNEMTADTSDAGGTRTRERTEDHRGDALDRTGERDGSRERPEAVTAPLMRVVVTLEETCVLMAVRAYMVMKRLAHMGSIIETVPSAREIEDERFDRVFEVVLETSASAEALARAVRAVNEVEEVSVSAVGHPQEKAAKPAGERYATDRQVVDPRLSETQTVRIAIDHLDKMVDLVGETMTLQARLEKLAQPLESKELKDVVERLHRVSGDLRHEVMQTRMVPVGNIFKRFPRMVRDLARELGKDVDFEIEGLEIELDRTVLDEIGDPLVHLLRNSIDHGLELPEERVASGKPRRGSVRLEASRRRENVLISVSDDGRGMDVDQIWEKALSLGVVTEDKRGDYPEQDILLFTCLPGFSTAKQATKFSGRGVGMDVVKGKVEYLAGSLRIDSKRGEGTTFTLTLPLTLAVVQVLLFSDGRQTLALPLSAVEEILDSSDLPVDTIDGAPVITSRDGEIVPLYRLDALTGSTGNDPFALPQPEESVLLVDTGVTKQGLTVQHLLGRSVVVVKPMSRVFRGVGGLGGAAVLGDGTMALILDPRSVFDIGEGHLS